MKRVRYGAVGPDQPGLIERAGVLRNLSQQVPELHLPALGLDGLAELGRHDAESLRRVPDTPRLGLPCTGIRKVVGIGLLDRHHAAEAGRRVTARDGA